MEEHKYILHFPPTEFYDTKEEVASSDLSKMKTIPKQILRSILFGKSNHPE
jgi:hypothetical protein